MFLLSETNLTGSVWQKKKNGGKIDKNLITVNTRHFQVSSEKEFLVPTNQTNVDYLNGRNQPSTLQDNLKPLRIIQLIKGSFFNRQSTAQIVLRHLFQVCSLHTSLSKMEQQIYKYCNKRYQITSGTSVISRLKKLVKGKRTAAHSGILLTKPKTFQ